ncbi:AIG_G0025610.mRNA.1.CDS.1 [Saccharomyces cerevisiae]|nr:AIG_G0025610.mRNA.1.CDS.1 [Saccharomyces cerevisiae]CAI6726591.1 AIG_G0025610.mRNA.1.CDS.1 [Saccharomyces cerevisiae]
MLSLNQFLETVQSTSSLVTILYYPDTFTGQTVVFKSEGPKVTDNSLLRLVLDSLVLATVSRRNLRRRLLILLNYDGVSSLQAPPVHIRILPLVLSLLPLVQSLYPLTLPPVSSTISSSAPDSIIPSSSASISGVSNSTTASGSIASTASTASLLLLHPLHPPPASPQVPLLSTLLH